VSTDEPMMASMAEHRLRLNVDLDIRIGMASGPVVGGVIGERRILFDLWGDAVNLASRMESSGVAGRIQISGATRSLLGDSLDCVAREVDVKGFSRQTTHLVG